MPGPKSDKQWADAIRVAVNEHMEGNPKNPKKIRQLASNLVDLALSGESWAVQEVGNRLDGRPHQSVAVGGDEESPIHVVTKIERVIVDPKD